MFKKVVVQVQSLIRVKWGDFVMFYVHEINSGKNKTLIHKITSQTQAFTVFNSQSEKSFTTNPPL